MSVWLSVAPLVRECLPILVPLFAFDHLTAQKAGVTTNANRTGVAQDGRCHMPDSLTARDANVNRESVDADALSSCDLVLQNRLENEQLCTSSASVVRAQRQS